MSLTDDPAPPWQAGMTAVSVSRTGPSDWDLAVTFAAAIGQPPPGQSPIPPGITPDNLSITDLADIAVPGLTVASVTYPAPPGDVLTVSLQAAQATTPEPTIADPPPSLLRLEGVTNLNGPQSWIGFLLSSGGPPAASPSRPVAPPSATSRPPPGLPVDYLSRDYAALRSVMLNRLAALRPGSAQDADEPADPMTTLVEVLALAGDHLGYHQDAVATEAYLVTARRRESVRRHARLLDYVLYEGCNSRTFVSLTVSGADIYMPAGTRVITQQLGAATAALPPATSSFDPGTVVFETMQLAALDESLNQLAFVLDALPPVLPPGTTAAVLQPWTASLAPGALLMIRSSSTAHPVRVTAVSPWTAPGALAAAAPDGMEVRWHVEDALPSALPIARLADGGEAAWVDANVVLADFGMTGAEPPVDLGTVPWERDFRPMLASTETVVYAQPLAPDAAGASSARSLLRQDPAAALPGVTLADDRGGAWTAWADLLNACAYSPAFVMERSDEGVGLFRFGDGVLGRKPAPGVRFQAALRSGPPSSAELPAGKLRQVLTDLPVLTVDNALPAMGAIAPQPALAAQMLAPGAYRRQLRGVVPADYAALARLNPMVRAAAAEVVTGASGAQFTVSVDTWLDIDDEAAVLAEVQASLAPYRVVGTGFTVAAPQVVGVNVVLGAFCTASADINGVRQRLAERFGSGLMANGEPAFFNPVNFPLGRPVVLSEIVAAAAAIDGVSWINADPRSDPRLAFGVTSPPADYFDTGLIPIGPTQVARADNDAAQPQHGSVAFMTIRRP